MNLWESPFSVMASKCQALMSVTAGHVLRLLKGRRLAYGPFFLFEQKKAIVHT